MKYLVQLNIKKALKFFPEKSSMKSTMNYIHKRKRKTKVDTKPFVMNIMIFCVIECRYRKSNPGVI